MTNYTEQELILLYNKLRPENGHWAQMIKRNIYCRIKEKTPEEYIEKLHYPHLKEPHEMPYENVPLHINCDEQYIQCIMHWRLEIGR